MYPTSTLEAKNLCDQGTAVIVGLERTAGFVNRVCAEMSDRLQQLVTASAYISCETSTGFGRHTDDWSVFALQLQGEKTFEVGIESSQRYQLAPGHWLFIERHAPHRAVRTHGRSLHVSFNLRVRPIA